MRRRGYKLDDALGETVREAIDYGDAWLERLFSHTVRRNGIDHPKYIYTLRIPGYRGAFVISKEAFEYGVREGLHMNIDGKPWEESFEYQWNRPVR